MRIWTLLHYSLNAYIARILYGIQQKPLNKPCYLIGGHNGQLYTDNAKVFYEYMLSKHPEIDIYWVVAKDSPMYHKIKGKKVILGSIKCYKYFYQSRVALFSDTLNSDIAPLSFILPFIRPLYDKVFKVYLSHGSIAFKKMPRHEGKIAKIKKEVFHSYNLAIASSQLSKKAILSYGVNAANIELLGSARNDTLYTIKSKEKIVLIAPTWRTWLNELSSFKESTFFHSYSKLLQDKTLHQHLRKHGYSVHFYLHHMFHQYWEIFKVYDNDVIKILPPKSDIEYKIKSAKIMITDYSSICADFYYLRKPVLFFQFDRELFIQKTGSEIDLKKDIFGDVYIEDRTLIQKIGEILGGNLDISNKQKEGEKYFIHFTDKKNCKRIDRAISHRLKALNKGM